VIDTSYAIEVVAARGRGQDRAAVFERSGGLVIALADGAGGTAAGDVAARAVVDGVAARRDGDAAWDEWLLALDADRAALGGGQTTAVVIVATARGLLGASVGDSGAWVIRGAAIEDLTEGQARKPLLGDGCRPFSISAPPLGARTLLVASDGLLRYAKPSDIARLAAGADLDAAARALVDLVRLPTGGLQDDVSVVLVRAVTA
jgi:PPM family protein phosphatase